MPLNQSLIHANFRDIIESMKYMGIDYGTKRVGVALSDDGGTIAFPKYVLKNSATLLGELVELIESEGVEELVVGKSIDQGGNRNELMDDIDAFVEALQQLSGKPAHMEDERFTSHFLKSFDFTKSIEKPISRERLQKRFQPVDDSHAAASILQRFLDKQR